MSQSNSSREPFPRGATRLDGNPRVSTFDDEKSSGIVDRCRRMKYFDRRRRLQDTASFIESHPGELSFYAERNLAVSPNRPLQLKQDPPVQFVSLNRSEIHFRSSARGTPLAYELIKYRSLDEPKKKVLLRMESREDC